MQKIVSTLRQMTASTRGRLLSRYSYVWMSLVLLGVGVAWIVWVPGRDRLRRRSRAFRLRLNGLPLDCMASMLELRMWCRRRRDIRRLCTLVILGSGLLAWIHFLREVRRATAEEIPESSRSLEFYEGPKQLGQYWHSNCTLLQVEPSQREAYESRVVSRMSSCE